MRHCKVWFYHVSEDKMQFEMDCNVQNIGQIFNLEISTHRPWPKSPALIFRMTVGQ